MQPSFDLPALTEDRRRCESLVEVFVGTDGLGPSRLATLVRRSPLPSTQTLDLLARGESSPVPMSNRRTTAWDELAVRFRAALVGGLPMARARWWLSGDPGWDARFGDDEDSPAALCVVGQLSALAGPRVAIVGTRSASAAGLAFARELGFALGRAGVSIVSGLARGIDGAAHRGATSDMSISGRPIGVLGTGTSIVYPREHHALQAVVAERGVLLSEYEPGRGPRPEAFPRRNRIVAQLAQAVVVVESGAKGGSLLTVNEATFRSRPVLAVPNNPLVRSAAGSNALLRESGGAPPLALPCHGVADILAVLDYQAVLHGERIDDRHSPEGTTEAILGAIGWDRRTTSAVSTESGLSLTETAVALAWLEEHRWIEHRSGRWSRIP